MLNKTKQNNFQKLGSLWHRPELREIVLDNMIWLILAISLVGFSFIPRFFQRDIFISILLHSTFLGILVIGETICLLTGNFDLSVESTLAFTAMFAAVLMGSGPPTPGWGISPLIAIPAMLAVGTMIGAFNGVCVSKLKINPFIVTLATLIVFRGLTIIFTNSQAVIRFPQIYKGIAVAKVGVVPVLIILTVILYAIFYFITKRTLFGRKLFAVGGNLEASYAFGLEPDKVIIVAYMFSGLLAALAGWFMSARLDAALPGMAEGMAFDVMAAAVIGGVDLKGGKGSLIGAFGGVLLLGSINAALTVAVVSPYWYRIVRGLVIFLAVGLDTLKRRLR
ncbi:MAG: ABC transporter permease [Anaerolineaceae bacterium]|nr:ABC transporter permease [Anaerolineaceae bacterium]